MTRYRKKPVEVEAWKVGSDEPRPDWVDVCYAANPHMGEHPGLWLIRLPSGLVRLCTNYQFEQTFEVVE